MPTAALTATVLAAAVPAAPAAAAPLAPTVLLSAGYLGCPGPSSLSKVPRFETARRATMASHSAVAEPENAYVCPSHPVTVAVEEKLADSPGSSTGWTAGLGSEVALDVAVPTRRRAEGVTFVSRWGPVFVTVISTWTCMPLTT